MPRLPFFHWLIRDARTGKMRRARWLMTEETATRYAGALKASATPAEWRDVGEPERTIGYGSMAAKQPIIANVERVEFARPFAPGMTLRVIA